MLKSVPDLLLVPDLFHTLKDLAQTMLEWGVILAQACDAGLQLALSLADCGLRWYAWGPLLALKNVPGRQSPTQDSLNGPQTDF